MNNVTVDPEMKNRIMGAVSAAIKEQSGSAVVTDIPKDKIRNENSGNKNQVRKAMFLENFRLVREKLADLKMKDYKRLLQPVIDGNEIMELFHLTPSRQVGELKKCLKDAVLDNQVVNEREPLMMWTCKGCKR